MKMKIGDPDGPEPDDLLLMGRVMKGHGIEGEVKVFCETDDPYRFEALDRLHLGREAVRTQSYEIETVRFQPHAKKGVIAIIKFETIDDRTDADGLRGLEAYADEADLPDLEEDEIFLHDLIGLHVEIVDGEEVGEVVDVLRLPAHDAFVVHRPDGGESIVPDVAEFVDELDVEANLLRITPIEGLLE